MLKVTIETTNAAFQDEFLHPELRQIFHRIVSSIRTNKPGNGVVRDSNGNRVGEWEYVPEYPEGQREGKEVAR